MKNKFEKLTQNQMEVFEQIATGNDSGHPQQTLASLAKLGYIIGAAQTLGGRFPVEVMRYEVPIPIHIEWCQWCATRPEAQDEANV